MARSFGGDGTRRGLVDDVDLIFWSILVLPRDTACYDFWENALGTDSSITFVSDSHALPAERPQMSGLARLPLPLLPTGFRAYNNPELPQRMPLELPGG